MQNFLQRFSSLLFRFVISKQSDFANLTMCHNYCFFFPGGVGLKFQQLIKLLLSEQRRVEFPDIYMYCNGNEIPSLIECELIVQSVSWPTTQLLCRWLPASQVLTKYLIYFEIPQRFLNFQRHPLSRNIIGLQILVCASFVHCHRWENTRICARRHGITYIERVQFCFKKRKMIFLS